MSQNVPPRPGLSLDLDTKVLIDRVSINALLDEPTILKLLVAYNLLGLLEG